MKKVALITGVTGQDGSYLAELLLNKDYEVYGLIRRSSTPNTSNLKDVLDNPSFHLVYGDLADSSSINKIVKEIEKQTPIIVVDMHGETTSEKVALGHYMNGRISALFGTHTHIQTADEKLLSQGTAYITDLGMTGPYDSVIGQDKDMIIKRFLTSMPKRFHVASEEIKLCGAVIEVDEKTGKAKDITRLQRDFIADA